MTTSIGGVSTPIIALIAAGGIFVLVALVTITAFICDLPARMRRRKARKESGGKPAILDQSDDVEKAEPAISVTEVDSQVSQMSKGSRSTTTPGTGNISPETMCQCEHPRPMPNRMPSFPKPTLSPH